MFIFLSHLLFNSFHKYSSKAYHLPGAVIYVEELKIELYLGMVARCENSDYREALDTSLFQDIHILA